MGRVCQDNLFQIPLDICCITKPCFITHLQNVRRIIGRNFKTPMTTMTLKEQAERKQLEFFIKGIEKYDKEMTLNEKNTRL